MGVLDHAKVSVRLSNQEKFTINLTLLFSAGWCALLAVYHVGCVDPALRASQARGAARILGALITAVAVGATAFLPVISSPALWIAVMIAWLGPVLAPLILVRLTGGPRPFQGGETRIAEVLAKASERVEARDPQGWREAIAELDSIHDPKVQPFLAAARGYADEIAAGAPAREETVARFQREYERAFRPPPLGRATVVLTVMVAAVVGLLPGLVLGRASACDQAERLLAAERASDPAPSRPASAIHLDPGSGFTLEGGGQLTLAEAAASRYDPDTLGQLQQAGFVSGSWAEWLRDTGTKLGIDAFEFETRSGALAYQQAVTRYACRYATSAFSIPGGGVGLRIRYGSGDPIRDQAAWVEETRRVVIAIGYRTAPADQSEILRLVDLARR